MHISLLIQIKLLFHWSKHNMDSYVLVETVVWRHLHDGFVYYKHAIFASLVWCGLLWCFYQLFGLSFWRHPFTAEARIMSKWCNAKFLQIDLFCYLNYAHLYGLLRFITYICSLQPSQQTSWDTAWISDPSLVHFYNYCWCAQTTTWFPSAQHQEQPSSPSPRWRVTCTHTCSWLLVHGSVMIRLLTGHAAEQMQDFIPACTTPSIMIPMRLYVYYANACYLSILAHAAMVKVFVTVCGRDDDASSISKHLLQRVNISLCDRREYRITCGTAGRVALETMRAMMSRRHHIVTAHSSIQLWPAFQSQVQDTQNKWQTPTNPLQLCK